MREMAVLTDEKEDLGSLIVLVPSAMPPRVLPRLYGGKVGVDLGSKGLNVGTSNFDHLCHFQNCTFRSC